jgi:hypothetical protein
MGRWEHKITERVPTCSERVSLVTYTAVVHVILEFHQETFTTNVKNKLIM